MSFGEEFLVEPDLFPARQAGEPWGDNTVVLDIASPISLCGLNDSQSAAIRRRFRLERLGASSARVASLPSVRCMRMGREEFVLFDRFGWEYTVELEPQPDRVRIAGYNFIGSIQLAPTLAGALWTCEEGSDEFPSVIENYSRILTAYQAVRAGGLLLHSAGVILNGRAYLFYGHSGAGKSTLTGNAVRDGNRILSDDLNLVLPGEPLKVRRIPFAGTYRRTPAGQETYPLAGLFHLTKGNNECKPLSPAAAFVSIIGSAPFVNRDPHRYARLTETVERFVYALRPREFAASKQGGIWRLVENPSG